MIDMHRECEEVHSKVDDIIENNNLKDNTRTNAYRVKRKPSNNTPSSHKAPVWKC